MTGMRNRVAAFLRQRKGAIVIKFALIIPVALLLAFSAMDYAWTLTHRGVLQSAADAAALAGAKELSLSDRKRENVGAVVEAIAKQYIERNSSNIQKKGSAVPSVTVSVTDDPLEVAVDITLDIDPLIGGDMGLEVGSLKVRSVARVIGQPNICVLALDETVGGALSLEKQALVTGRNCAVFSNSSHSNSIKSKDSARLTATFICSRGGKDGGPGNFSPPPMLDCPAFEDPLKGRMEEIPGDCKEVGLVINGGSRMLMPGTYCGGIHATNNAAVTLSSGVYVFKGGPFRVDSGASVEGHGVGLYFDEAEQSVIDFANESSIRLEAGTGGGMAGLLVFASRSQPDKTQHRLFSDDAPLLLGTIYIPNAELRVDANGSLAADSAYTAIVARKIRLYGGPHLVLNTDYDKTKVPVPEGIKGAGQPVQLVQ